jgi:hypothetical protein
MLIGDPREVEVSTGQQVMLGEGLGLISELEKLRKLYQPRYGRNTIQTSGWLNLLVLFV